MIIYVYVLKESNGGGSERERERRFCHRERMTGENQKI